MTGSPAFLTDRYELTMVDAAIQSGTADRQCLFEAFARRLPNGRRFGVVAGVGRLLQMIEEFRFEDAELRWLADNDVVRRPTLDWLADYRFHGTVRGYREGEIYFPGSPLIVVEASFAEGVLLETLVLSVLNYDSSVAGAAARMVSASRGRPLAEMGSRRTNERAGVGAARAAYIAGFSATSNLEAGRTWGVPTMGTAAHAFTLLHDTEEEAFRAQVAAFGTDTTLLVDTFDIPTGVERAVQAAGIGLGAVRIDSGDLPTLVVAVREQLDSLGATGTHITVTSDLDEFTIAALSAAPVDSFGVGTSVATGSGAPAAGMVYKLVAHQRETATGTEWVSVAKRSADKISVGGRKTAFRRLDADGVAREEIVVVGEQAAAVLAEEPGSALRPLTVDLIVDGVATTDALGVAGTLAAREHHERAIRELPLESFRLGHGEPVLPTTYR